MSSPEQTSSLAEHPGATLYVSLPETDQLRTFSFEDTVLVGRDVECDLSLDAAHISRHHVELHRVGGLWWVYDLGSDEGTYLDDERIDAAPVHGTCTLQLGTDGPVIWLVSSSASGFAMN